MSFFTKVMSKVNFLGLNKTDNITDKEIKETYSMRNASLDDIPFIMREISLGVSEGCYTQVLSDPNELEKYKKTLCAVIENMKSDKWYPDFLFVFENNKKEPVAYSLIIVESKKNINYLNIKMFGVKQSLRGKGIGKLFLHEILSANVSHNFKAECLCVAKAMVRILEGFGFKCVKQTPSGKKTFEKKAI